MLNPFRILVAPYYSQMSGGSHARINVLLFKINVNSVSNGVTLRNVILQKVTSLKH